VEQAIQNADAKHKADAIQNADTIRYADRNVDRERAQKRAKNNEDDEVQKVTAVPFDPSPVSEGKKDQLLFC
jgi:hypothetical protein